MKFEDWFEKKLKVSRYPTPSEIQKTGVNYVINVSCEYKISCQKMCMDLGVKYFWFPMDEVSGDIGLNSIFGALQILWIAEMENASVILHCHAGANRSPTVMEAYYFMRTKRHFAGERDLKLEKKLNKMFVGGYKSNQNNRLLSNIEAGHLPAKSKMESFLKKTEESFLKQYWENDLKTDSELNSIKFDIRL